MEAIHGTVSALLAAPRADSNGNDSLQLEWTSAAKVLLSRLVLAQLCTVGQDLEAFARHGKRTTILVDDVKLCLRRNPCLKDRLADFAKQFTPTTTNKRHASAQAKTLSEPQLATVEDS